MNQALGNHVDDNLSPTFTVDTAEKTGMDQRSIQRSIRRAEKISQEVRDEIRGTDIADSGVQTRNAR
jgi:hypothetical protein